MVTIYVSSPYTSTRRHLRLNALTIQKASLWEAFLLIKECTSLDNLGDFMFEPSGIGDNLLFTTIRIQTNDGVGTGFFFEFHVNDQQVLPVVITNKHVVSTATEGALHFHLCNQANDKSPLGKFYNLKIGNFNKAWAHHPDESVDLCAMPIAPLLEKVKKDTGMAVFYRSINENIIMTDEELKDLTAIEDVIMVGYPNGLWDEVNNFPIIRKGITASHPGIDFANKKLGVVDIASFPGSSGSPIFIFNPSGYLNKRTNSINMQGRIILLGALYAGPQMQAEGSIEIKEIPTQATPVSKTNMMIHLGYYVKASEIKVLGKMMLSSIPK